MRIFGNVLMVLGILLLVLFIMAAFGGGMPWSSFFIPILLISIGFRLRTFGRGILQDAPGARSGTASSAPAAAASTVELPITPEVIAAIERQIVRAKKMMWWVTFGAVGLFFLLGVIFWLVSDNSGDKRLFLMIFVGAGAASGILISGIQWLFAIRPVQSDLRALSYFRTTGPIQLVYIRNGHMLRLADQAFLLKGRDGVSALKDLAWGTIDHTQHGHLILAAWNREGALAYVAPGYTASQVLPRHE